MNPWVVLKNSKLMTRTINTDMQILTVCNCPICVQTETKSND